MTIDGGLVDWIGEAMAPLGTVTTRRMFGGAALYCDGVIFALIAMDDLWFKGDAESAAEWEALGAEPFTYHQRDGRAVVTSYRRAPADAHDDPDAVRRYGRLGLAASLRRRDSVPGVSAPKARVSRSRRAGRG